MQLLRIYCGYTGGKEADESENAYVLAIVETYIEQHCLLPSEGTVVVAVSGGADSLCLLHILNRLCGEGKRYSRLALQVAHLNHKLRGEEGERDAAYVARIASAWGL